MGDKIVNRNFSWKFITGIPSPLGREGWGEGSGRRLSRGILENRADSKKRKIVRGRE
jgi:hypothetical protein